MDVLKELALIVSKNRNSQVETLDLTNGANTKIGLFYEGILNNSFQTDEEAAASLYQTNKKASKYKKLKYVLKNRLINNLFFIDVSQPSYNERQKAYYECYKEWAAVKILLGKNARTAAVSLSLKILKQAQKYEFTELTLDLARMFRLHYGTIIGDLKKYELYCALFEEYEKIWQNENLIEGLYTDLMTRYVKTKANQLEVHTKAKEYLQQIQPILETYNSYGIQFCGSLIKIIIQSSINDYEKTILVCQESVRLFKQKPYIARLPLQIAYQQMLICNIQLKQYKEGKESAENALAFMEVGAFNWFKHQEYFFILAMHTKKYQEAYDVFYKTLKNNRFNYLPSPIQETWKIFAAYIHYLVEVGQVFPKDTDRRFNKFRLGRFLNETLIFSKDKRGMNIPILIIHILFMILQKKYNLAIDRMEAIDKYCSRYLKKGENFRSNCFIRLLLIIPQANFHKAAVERKASKYLEKLIDVPLEVSNQSHEIEIIPYEDLWTFAVISLENNIFRSNKKKK